MVDNTCGIPNYDGPSVFIAASLGKRLHFNEVYPRLQAEQAYHDKCIRIPYRPAYSNQKSFTSVVHSVGASVTSTKATSSVIGTEATEEYNKQPRRMVNRRKRGDG